MEIFIAKGKNICCQKCKYFLLKVEIFLVKSEIFLVGNIHKENSQTGCKQKSATVERSHNKDSSISSSLDNEQCSLNMFGIVIFSKRIFNK